MSEIEVILKEKKVSSEVTELEAFLKQLSIKRSRKITFFDEVLTGYVLLTKQPKEIASDVTVDITIQDSKSHKVLQASVLNLKHPHLSNDTQSIYTFELRIPFPKVQLAEPMLKIRAQTNLKVKKDEELIKGDTPKTLRSFYPAESRNILEGINHSILHNNSNIVLSNSLINTDQLDINSQETLPHSIKSTDISSELSLPIIRTLSLRLRNIRLKNNIILSTIDIEQSSKSKEAELSITLSDISFKFQSTIIPKFAQKFPIDITKNDSYCFTYELESTDLINYNSFVHVNYTINDTHTINTKLLTNIDFSTPLSTTLKRGGSTSTINSIGSSLNIKFKGEKIIKLGEPSKLTVHIENKSPKERNLLLLFNSTNNDNFIPNLPKIKSLTQPNNHILKTYSTLRIKPVVVLSLVNEIHFKIPSEQIFENEIVIMGLEVGVFNVQGVKLIDLQTHENIHCDRLLEIIVEK